MQESRPPGVWGGGGVRASNSNLSNSLKKVNKNRLSAIPTPPLKLPLLQWEI